MGRRTGLLEDLAALGTRLPWGVTVVLAVLAYGGFHRLAVMTPGAPGGMVGLGTSAGLQLIAVVASFLQYLLPFGLLIGALASYFRRKRGASLLTDASANPTAAIHSMSWLDFERLVGAHFEQEGYAVEHAGGGGADGGVDLVLKKGRESTLVQCKQWRAQKVGVTTVRELYGVMAARGAAQGIVVTSGEFTPDAREFAAGRNIDLLNGRVLATILRNPTQSKDVAQPETSPKCSQCGSQMVMRVARKGPRAGQSFWGCETYPRCRATLPLENSPR